MLMQCRSKTLLGTLTCRFLECSVPVDLEQNE